MLAELSVARGAGHVGKGGRTPRHFHLNGVADMLASSITAEELFQAFEDAIKGAVGLTRMSNTDMFRDLLHCVTYHDYPAALPDPGVRLNQVLACEWQVNGQAPMINGWHLRPIVITAYPGETLPQMLAVLLRHPGYLTLSIRYRCLSHYDAQKKLEAEKPFWKQTVVGDFMEIIKGFFGAKKDAGQHAFERIAELNDAIAASQSGTSFGTVSCVAIMRDRDPEQADTRAHNFVGLLQGNGLMARIETAPPRPLGPHGRAT